VTDAVPASPALAGPLVVRSPNWLGDAVMALPAVRNLKTLIGAEPLAVATPEKLAALWRACPFVDRVIALPNPKNIGAVAQQLREGNFTTAVLLPNSLRAALEAWRAGIPQRVGYARGGRGLFLTRTVPVPKRDPVRLHQKYYYLDLAAAVGAPTDESLPELRRPVTEPNGANEKSNLPSPLLPTAGAGAICPGAEYGAAKRWPLESFVAVGQALVGRGLPLVILGAKGDAALAAQLAEKLPGARNRAGETTLEEFMAELAAARLVISNDSGAMHLASALGVPTLAIFGSTEPALTGPLGTHTAILRHHVPCSPCFLRECPLDFACMTSITPERVLAAAAGLLDGRTQDAKNQSS
jgi:heptosyltransferase-2